MLLLQENGLLLSCAYDKTIIVWKYEEEREVTRFEKTEELRCMDYLSSTKTLFVGTNQKSILTINIEEIIAIGAEKHFYGTHDDSIQYRDSGRGQSHSKPSGSAILDESAAVGNMTEEDIEAMLRHKQSMLDNLNLQDDDPLKKIMSNHDQIVKKHQGGK